MVLAGCSFDVPLDTSHLVCPDGQCPAGFACVNAICVGDPQGAKPGSCNQISLVADDFAAGARDPRWGASYASGGAATSQVNGRLRINLPANLAGAAYAGYRTDRYFDLTGSRVAVEIAQMVNPSSHAQMVLQLLRSGDPVLGESAGFEQQFGSLKLFARSAGHEDATTVPYDAASQRFWQLREHDGQLYFEASSDGETWKALRQIAAPFPLTLLRVDLTAGVYEGEADPGVAEFEAVNAGKASGQLCKAATISDDFGDGQRDQRWANSYNDPNCDVGEADGSLFATPPDFGLGVGYCAYRSAAAFDLTGSQVVVEVSGMIDPAPGSPGHAFLKLTAPMNGHGVEMVQEAGQLACRQWRDGQFSDVDHSDWDPGADRFWRVAERNGEVTWATSSDGGSWQQRCSAPTSSVKVDDIQIEIGAGTNGAPAAGQTIGTFRVDQLNPAP